MFHDIAVKDKKQQQLMIESLQKYSAVDDDMICFAIKKASFGSSFFAVASPQLIAAIDEDRLQRPNDGK